MQLKDLKRALSAAVAASKAVGALMRRNLLASKRTNAESQHDIKLELDVLSQGIIERALHRVFPRVALLGEEGVAGDPAADWRWVVDPIDGTVNFAYGIPHACVSIALQHRLPVPDAATFEDGFQTVVGVVYEPFCDELWTAIRGQSARLNGKPIHVSKRAKLNEAIVSIGFAKSRSNLEATLPYFIELVHRVRKLRMMGSAALALTYVATGRFDAYIERGIRLWDVAAGGLIVECAGGQFWTQAVRGRHAYQMIASNRLLHRRLRVPKAPAR
jgi:myo-inositol-1(or 4)-monophosphatase